MRVSSACWRRVAAVLPTGAVAVVAGTAWSDGRLPPPRPEVYAWGSGLFGETGLGHEKDVARPTRVAALGDLDVAALASSGTAASSAALTADGAVYTWGCGRDGRLGHGAAGVANSDSPRRVEGLQPSRAVALGEVFGVAISRDGALYSWGRRALGRGDTAAAVGRVEGLSDVVGAACGREHAIAITAAGVAYSWGVGMSYALGHGDKATAAAPRVVEGLRGTCVGWSARGRTQLRGLRVRVQPTYLARCSLVPDRRAPHRGGGCRPRAHTVP